MRQLSRMDFELVIADLVGLFAWGCRPGVGSFMTLEFGDPYLEVFESKKPMAYVSPKIEALMLRRRVVVRGEWSLWICDSDWELVSPNGSVKSNDVEGAAVAATEIDGRTLIAWDTNDDFSKSSLVFEDDRVLSLDLRVRADGAVLQQWCLYSATSDPIALEQNGLTSGDV